MVEFMSDNFTDLQLDVLKELINIGGAHGATSISQLIGKPVNMEVPLIEIMAYEELYQKIMAEDQQVYGVMSQVYGDAGGVFLFALSVDSADLLTTMMMPTDIPKTDVLMESATKELVNIIVNSFLNAISKMLDVNLVSSVPLLRVEMFGAIISSLYMELEQYDEQVMVIRNEFFYLGDKLEAALYFIPKEGVLEKLFKAFGV